MTNKDILKKQIIYRSMHRGTKEMDMLLGNFVKKYINKLNDNELKNLLELLFFDDEVIYKWYQEKFDIIDIINISLKIPGISFLSITSRD